LESEKGSILESSPDRALNSHCQAIKDFKKLHEEKMNSPQALRLSLAMVIHAKVYLWYAYAITEVSVAIMKYIGRYSQTDHLKNGLVIIASSAF
jgi:hypothetical protein